MNSLNQATPAKSLSTSWVLKTIATSLIFLITFIGMSMSHTPAHAVDNVPTGHLANVSVFANVDLLNNGTSTISGDVNINTSSSLLGLVLPTGISLSGLVNLGNATTAQVKVDCDAVYANLSARPITATVNADLGGRTLTAGVYVADVLRVNGVLTLDAKGDSNAIFILRANAKLDVGANAVIKLVNGARSDRVFWRVGTTATIGANAQFVGRLFAQASIVANLNAYIRGSLLSCGAGVELNTNTVNTAVTVGADVPVPSTSLPVSPQEVADELTDPGAVLSDDTATSQPISDEQAASSNVLGTSASDDSARTSSSGLLAYTGRNAETIIPIALALLGLGWAAAVTFYRKRQAVTDQEL